MFGEGISREGDILDNAVNIGIVNKAGAWYAYEGEKIGQGRENAKQLLKDRPELCEEIDQKVRDHYAALRAEEAEKEAAQAAAKAGRPDQKSQEASGAKTAASKKQGPAENASAAVKRETVSASPADKPQKEADSNAAAGKDQ